MCGEIGMNGTYLAIIITQEHQYQINAMNTNQFSGHKIAMHLYSKQKPLLLFLQWQERG